MRQIREVLRLHLECGRTKREIARALNMARKHLTRAILDAI